MGNLNDTVGALGLFGDPTRVRLLALLARHELSVAELVAITRLGQSRVSTHLGRLKEAGVLRDRRDGASTRYALTDGTMPDEARRLWEVLEPDLSDPVLEADRRRCTQLQEARRRPAWPDDVAGEMERHYSPGRTWEALARAFLGLMRLGDVLDAGAGDGTVAHLLAPRARSVTCVERSPRMAAAARGRLRHLGARVGVADVEALPWAAATFDQVLLFNVLTCTGRPAQVIGEAARVLRPGGQVVLVTLDRHEHADVTSRYGHCQAGFAPARLRRWFAGAGLRVEACEVSSREAREPHFGVVTAFASKPVASEKR
jgi:ArsR family transcriptional regulator